LSDTRLAGRLALCWAGTILFFALVPTHFALSRTVGDRETLATQVGHFVEFALLAGLVAWWLTTREGRRDVSSATGAKRGTAVRHGVLAVALAWAVAAGYGAFIEIVQMPLPYRSAQWSDVAIDAAGALAGVVVFSCGRRWRGRTRRGRDR
jgi:Flp pilus assembly pilin Flp